jgi:hypothetical protein
MGVLNHKTILAGVLAPMVLLPLSLLGQDTDLAQPAVEQAPVNVVPPRRTLLPGEAGSTVDKRAFGVLPNYRTADGSLPFSPLTANQKFTIAFKDTVDGPSYALAAFFSGISQLNNSNPSFGQGLKGYSRRYGSAIADQGIGNFMTEAIYPSLFHQDPRYFRRVHGTVTSRALYAASRVMVTKNDSGKWTFNAAEVVGNGTVAAIGFAYYPDGRTFPDTMQRMWSQIGTDAISNVLKEFWPDIKHHFAHRHDAVGVIAD